MGLTSLGFPTWREASDQGTQLSSQEPLGETSCLFGFGLQKHDVGREHT